MNFLNSIEKRITSWLFIIGMFPLTVFIVLIVYNKFHIDGMTFLLILPCFIIGSIIYLFSLLIEKRFNKYIPLKYRTKKYKFILVTIYNVTQEN